MRPQLVALVGLIVFGFAIPVLLMDTREAYRLQLADTLLETAARPPGRHRPAGRTA